MADLTRSAMATQKCPVSNFVDSEVQDQSIDFLFTVTHLV